MKYFITLVMLVLASPASAAHCKMLDRWELAHLIQHQKSNITGNCIIPCSAIGCHDKIDVCWTNTREASKGKRKILERDINCIQ